MATVYRALRGLCEAGLAAEVVASGEAARFDANTSAHGHAVCDACGRIEDVALWLDLDELHGAAGRGGFVVRGYRVHLRGLCSECASASETPSPLDDAEKDDHGRI